MKSKDRLVVKVSCLDKTELSDAKIPFWNKEEHRKGKHHTQAF